MQIIEKYIISNNKGKQGANVPKYIVIHDTGNTKNTANAENHYKWLNNNNDLGRSAHIFVDDTQAIQVIPLDTPSFHCGVKYINEPLIKDCTNFNSIGIEFCINADGDIYHTLTNTAEVVVELMKRYNIAYENIITHYQCTGKKCPGTFMNDDGIMEIFFQDVKFLCESDDVFKSNLVYLQSKGVMNTPAYWERNVNTIPHLKELINNMADVLRKESCL